MHGLLPFSPVVPAGNSLEVLRVLRDGHVDDIQCVLVVLLGGEEECQQVEGIGIVPAHFEGLLQLLHGAGDLPEKAANLAIFPRPTPPPRALAPSASHQGGTRLGETLGTGGQGWCSDEKAYPQVTWQEGSSAPSQAQEATAVPT